MFKTIGLCVSKHEDFILFYFSGEWDVGFGGLNLFY